MSKKSDGWMEKMMRHWWGNLLFALLMAGASYWMYLDNLKLAAGGTTGSIRGRLWFEVGGVWGGPIFMGLCAVGFAVAAGVQLSKGSDRA